jgi:hypothetical protein
MLGFLGRLVTLVAGVHYFTVGYYLLFPNAPFAESIESFFERDVLSALAMLVGIIAGCIAANFWWQKRGLLAKLLSVFAIIPLFYALAAINANLFESVFGHDGFMFFGHAVFFASGIVLLLGAFLVGRTAQAPKGARGH